MAKEKPEAKSELYKLTTNEKLVYRVLEDHGPLFEQEIMELARLSRSAVQRAKYNMLNEGHIEERHCIDNPNKKRYAVSEDSGGKRTVLEKYSSGGSSGGGE